MELNFSNIPGFKKGGNDSKFFTTTKKGEIHDLKIELNDQRPDKRKDAVKKVIAAMTVGKDVSSLFPDVLNCMQTASVELKKLVYLYLINYAKTKPDMAILAVNTFRRDANAENPLIRALAIRTMGCIRVDKITEYLCDPLRRTLKDDDPYVRKTAALCVAKLYDISPDLCEEQGFVSLLQELVSDSNPTVVANAVAALTEIASHGDPKIFTVNDSTLAKLLAALSECAEWGQVYILEALSTYKPKNGREAESIIERITPRLQHSNSAVVMGSVKIIVNCLDLLDNPDTVKALGRKMSPPLITLLSAEPEIQYIALRNINIVVQKHPHVLSGEIRVFFCRYNDPIYVKMEKLELIVLLCTERNAEQVLLELKEYATEVDVDFVRKATRAIGRIAIKLERSAEKCINVLLDLIKTRVNYVVQESVIVIKDIFRRYPNRYESIIATLCDNLESLDEPEAKASMIWIVGEYASRIDNADELLENFLDNFVDETSEVQLQLLTAAVKLYLKRPEDSKQLMEDVLNMSTERSDNPDLRDRGYIYWRLLASDPEAAKNIVLSDKPVINDDSSAIDGPLLDELCRNIGSLSSVYHKPPETFVKRTTYIRERDSDSDSSSDSDSDDNETNDKSNGGSNNIEDLLGFGGPSSSSSSSNGDIDMLGGMMDGGERNNMMMESMPQLMDSNGIRIDGMLSSRDGSSDQAYLDLKFYNNTDTELQDFKVQLNKNCFGFVPENVSLSFPQPLVPGASTTVSIPIIADTNKAVHTSSTVIDVALKILATGVVEYFKVNIDLIGLLSQNGKAEKKPFIANWQSLAKDETSKATNVKGIFSHNVDVVNGKLSQYRIFNIASRQVNDKQVAYYSCQPASCSLLLIEMQFKDGFDACKLNIRSKEPQMLSVFLQAIENLMQN